VQAASCRAFSDAPTESRGSGLEEVTHSSARHIDDYGEPARPPAPPAGGAEVDTPPATPGAPAARPGPGEARPAPAAAEIEALRGEVAALEARAARAGPPAADPGIDTGYLRAVLVQGLATGQLAAQSALLPVLTELLRLSPREASRVRAAPGGAGRGLPGGFSLPLPLPGFGGGAGA